MTEGQWKMSHKTTVKFTEGTSYENFLLWTEHPSFQIPKPNMHRCMMTTDV